MGHLLEEFGAGHPEAVVRRGGETYVAASRVGDVIDTAERRGVRLLGSAGFLVDEETVYPALSRIADLSNDTPPRATERARALLAGPWALLLRQSRSTT